jgi:hypothetical protein
MYGTAGEREADSLVRAEYFLKESLRSSQSGIGVGAYMDTYTHTFIHACMHACIHECMCIQTCTHIYMNACMHAYIHNIHAVCQNPGRHTQSSRTSTRHMIHHTHTYIQTHIHTVCRNQWRHTHSSRASIHHLVHRSKQRRRY